MSTRNRTPAPHRGRTAGQIILALVALFWMGAPLALVFV